MVKFEFESKIHNQNKNNKFEIMGENNAFSKTFSKKIFFFKIFLFL